jgi:hypothetical protein
MGADWTCVALTLAVLGLYEGLLVLSGRLALARHAGLREEWFRAVSLQKGSELLAVQTLRNSLMSATMLASTAALALMGTVTLAAPSLHGGLARPGPRLVLELVLLALLFAALVSSMLAVRFYNHAGFIGGMPADSQARARWTGAGVRYVRRAGLLYGVGLRQLVLIVPVIATLLMPALGPLAALLVAALLYALDCFNEDAGG